MYETDETTVRHTLAETPFEFASARIVFYAGLMLDHDLGALNSWRFSSFSLPVRFNGDLGIWSILMFCDDSEAIMAGRELLGEPKKWADMNWQRNHFGLEFSLGLLGEAPVRLDAQIGDRLEKSIVAEELGLQGPMALLNHRFISSPAENTVVEEEVVAVRVSTNFRYRSVSLGQFSIDRPSNVKLDTLLAPMHRFAIGRVAAANFREGSFENGAGPSCSVFWLGKQRSN